MIGFISRLLQRPMCWIGLHLWDVLKFHPTGDYDGWYTFGCSACGHEQRCDCRSCGG